MNPAYINAAVQGAAAAGFAGGAFEILFFIIVFFCILALAYLAAKFVGKRASGRMRGRLLEIVDTLAVGADAQILVVKAGSELFLVSRSAKQISFLTKLDLKPDEIAENEAAAPLSFTESFKAVLESRLSRSDRPKSGNGGGGQNG